MGFQLIHPREMEHVIKKRNAVVIDLRKDTEYKKEHYVNAVHIPYEEFVKQMANKKKGNEVMILYCDYGSASLMAARMLAKHGWEIYSVIGGYDAIRNFYFH